jgi:hypothetical protein
LACTTACAHPAAADSDVRSFNGVPLAPNVTCFDARCSSYNVQPYVRTRSRYGIGCMGNVPPGTTMNPQLPPESYAVGDIGKPGFPVLTPAEAGMVARIGRYVRSNALRIAWVHGAHEGERQFIVFNAVDGPCKVSAPGYPVLNGFCNEVFQPGEIPYNTHATTGCYPPNAKRPWMPNAPR